MRPTEEQIKENKRLSKLTPYQRYKEIVDPEYQKKDPNRWVIFRALVDYEIRTGADYFYFGEFRVVKPKAHFMNKCPKNEELLKNEEIPLPPKGISRKKANGICLLKAIQNFYTDFDPEKFRYLAENCHDNFVSDIIWARYNVYMKNWRKMNGNVNKETGILTVGCKDWLSITFNTATTSSGIKFSCDNRSLNSEQYMSVVEFVLGMFDENNIPYEGFMTILKTLQYSEKKRVIILDPTNSVMVVGGKEKYLSADKMTKINKCIALEEDNIDKVNIGLSTLEMRRDSFAQIFNGVFFVVWAAIFLAILFPQFFRDISQERFYLNF